MDAIGAPTQGAQSPSALQSLWKWWQGVGKKIGDIQARALLILFYFVLLGPFALVIRWGSDPLAIKAGAPRGWRLKAEGEGPPMERATRQF